MVPPDGSEWHKQGIRIQPPGKVGRRRKKRRGWGRSGAEEILEHKYTFIFLIGWVEVAVSGSEIWPGILGSYLYVWPVQSSG